MSDVTLIDRAHRLRARGLRRLRGHLEGADDAAHAAHVAARTRSTASSSSARSSCSAHVGGTLATVLGFDRGRVRRRSTWSAASSSPTACSRCSRRPGESAAGEVTRSLSRRATSIRARLPRRGGAVHPRPQAPVARRARRAAATCSPRSAWLIAVVATLVPTSASSPTAGSPSAIAIGAVIGAVVARSACR